MPGLRHFIDIVAALHEGRVYRVDWGYPIPVMIISNPSQAQARTLVETIHAKNYGVYIRGLLNGETVYVWDGWSMTHDDVLSKLLPDVYAGSDELCLFEIANYRQIDFIKREEHSAQTRVTKAGPDPDASPFVQNIIRAIDALPPKPNP